MNDLLETVSNLAKNKPDTHFQIYLYLLPYAWMFNLSPLIHFETIRTNDSNAMFTGNPTGDFITQNSRFNQNGPHYYELLKLNINIRFSRF